MPVLYRGVWPQNVSSLAKFVVRQMDGQWQVTVQYEAGEGLTFFGVEGSTSNLQRMINDVKTAVGESPGGPFYVNEYRHVIVPVRASGESGTGSHYYFAGRLEDDLRFEFEKRPLTTRAVKPDGTPLSAGERWVGPRPGIPYKLAAGASDIYYETPALTDEDPPTVRPGMTRKVQLSRVLPDKSALSRALRGVAAVRGHSGGRFYVNEHGAMFSPVSAGDGKGIDYICCGQIDKTAWFPEPVVR